MKRTNPSKGKDEDPEFVKISWNEALDTIAEKLNTTVDEYGQESLMFVMRSHNHANSSRLAQAQIILNALVGSIDRRGGIILSRNPSSPSFDEVFPRPEYPESIEKRIDAWEQEPIISGMPRGNFATLAEGIMQEDPYPIKAALMRGYTTLSFPNAHKMTKALSELDFLVTFEFLPTELVQLSDIVLPEPLWLESSSVHARGYHSLHPQYAIRMPASEQLYDTKGAGTIFQELAERMGYGEYFEGVSGSKWNDEQLRAVGTSWEELSNSESGLWSREIPFEPAETFNTPSGKIEMYSSVLRDNDFDPLPYWQPKLAEPSDEYPFYFVISRPAVHNEKLAEHNDPGAGACMSDFCVKVYRA